MLAENIVLYLQNTHFVLLFNILCIEFHENFCEASLNYSQHAGRKKLRYFLLWKGEKSHWCKDRGWCKGRSMTVYTSINFTCKISIRGPLHEQRYRINWVKPQSQWCNVVSLERNVVYPNENYIECHIAIHVIKWTSAWFYHFSC